MQDESNISITINDVNRVENRSTISIISMTSEFTNRSLLIVLNSIM